jgi:hypothetical protein
MTKWELIKALMATDPAKAKIRIGNNYGMIQAVQRESGCGRAFNVTLGFEDGTTRTVFVRTDD